MNKYLAAETTLLATAIGLALSAAPMAAWPAAASDSNAPLEEIIVTAAKRNETVQIAATQVTALKGSDLEDRGLKTLQDYADAIPGLNVITLGTPVITEVSLRGIASTSSSATVATFIDESPLGSSGIWNAGAASILSLLPYDLDRLEVLSGPQGTLYGAGSLGGLIKYVMTPANPSKFEAKVGAEVSDTAHAGKLGESGRLMVNVPLIQDQLALRFSLYDDYSPGWIDNVNGNAFNGGVKDINVNTNYGGRLALFWQPIDALKVKFNWVDGRSLSQGLGQEWFNSATITTNADGAVFGVPTDPVGKYQTTYAIASVFRKIVDNYSLNIDYNTPYFDVLSATTYSKQKVVLIEDDTPFYGAFIPLLFAGASSLEVNEQPVLNKFSQELRFTSPQGRTIEWLIGGFYTDERSSLPEYLVPLNTSYQIVPTPPALSEPASATGYPYAFGTALPTTYKEAAIFGDTTWNITQKWDVSGGVRYATNKQQFSAITSGNAGFLVGINPNAQYGPVSKGVTTWAASSRYKFTPDVMAYARVATGYQAGGPNSPLPTIPPVVEPSTLTNYELGFKSEFFDKSVLFDLAAFYIDWTKIQVGATQGSYSYLANGGTATSKGLELTTAWRPIRDLKLGLTAAYTEAVLNTVIANSSLVAGYQLPSVPKFEGNLTVDYSYTLFNDWRGSVGGAVRYRGQTLSGVPEHGASAQPVSYVSAFTTESLYAGLSNGRYTTKLYVNNLSNSHAAAQESAATNVIGMPYGTRYPLQPRTIGLSLDVSF